jgi:hypothetical protein
VEWRERCQREVDDGNELRRDYMLKRASASSPQKASAWTSHPWQLTMKEKLIRADSDEM